MQKANKGKMKFSRDGLVAGLMLTPAVIFLIVCSRSEERRVGKECG